jgi:hypothetical protein
MMLAELVGPRERSIHAQVLGGPDDSKRCRTTATRAGNGETSCSCGQRLPVQELLPQRSASPQLDGRS